MKTLLRASLFTLAAVACAPCAYGRARASGYCQQGGQTVQVLGYQSSAATPVQGSYTGSGCNVLVLYGNGPNGATGPSGSVSTSGTAVTWASGTRFNANGQWSGLTITISSTPYVIAGCSSSTSCMLTSSAGTQAVAAYSMPPATPAAIFSDNSTSGTPKSNPFVVSSTGYWFYYADNGSYTNQYSGTAIANTYTNAALPLIDPASLQISVTPEQFGAKGDGVTNDSAACQAASNFLAVTGGIINFGPYTYECNFTAGSNIWLRGSGAGPTVIQSYAGSNADIFQSTHFAALDNTPQQIPETRGDNYIRMSDITFDGNKANNLSGYCARVWGMGMYWTNVVCQNGASGGLVTEYSDGSGTVYFPSNPKLGDTRAHFTSIRNYNNNGTGWLYEGPNDGVINGWIGTLNTQWGIDWEAKLLRGTVNTSGTAVTWVSGSVFTGLVAGAGFQIAGTAYTISSCSSSTACTLTTSAGSQSGASYLVVFYLGTTDEFSDGNDYGDGQSSPYGCFNEGPNAGSLAWTSVIASSCYSGITMDVTDGDEKMTNMTVNGNSGYGVKLQGTGNHFEGEVSGNGIGLILNEGDSVVKVHGTENTTSISVILEAAGYLYATFGSSSTYILNPQNIGASETAVVMKSGSNTPAFLQIPGLFITDIGGTENYLIVPNQTTPADYVKIEHTGSTGDGQIDAMGHGSLYLNLNSQTPVYYPAIGPCAAGAGCNTWTIGSPGAGETQLPAASSVALGLSYFVVDLNSPAFNTSNAGGGAAKGYVYSNGVSWVVY